MTNLNPPPQKLPQKIQEDDELRIYFDQIQRSIYQLFAKIQHDQIIAVQEIEAIKTIIPSQKIHRIKGKDEAVTMTATPSIDSIEDGQEIILQGIDDDNTVTLQDNSNLANSGLSLNGNADFTLGKGDMLHLIYDKEDGVYYEISRSDN